MNSMPSKEREGKIPKRRTPLEDDGDEYGADTVREGGRVRRVRLLTPGSLVRLISELLQ